MTSAITSPLNNTNYSQNSNMCDGIFDSKSPTPVIPKPIYTIVSIYSYSYKIQGSEFRISSKSAFRRYVNRHKNLFACSCGLTFVNVEKFSKHNH